MNRRDLAEVVRVAVEGDELAAAVLAAKHDRKHDTPFLAAEEAVDAAGASFDFEAFDEAYRARLFASDQP